MMTKANTRPQQTNLNAGHAPTAAEPNPRDRWPAWTDLFVPFTMTETQSETPTSKFATRTRRFR